MGLAERRNRERAAREARIVAAARGIAEREGWGAVTVRRLAEEIAYSQPVLYGHFRGRDAIVAAVAVQGFSELAAVLRGAREAAQPGAALERVATAYLAFAFRHPALYEAMFVLATDLPFAESDAPPALREAFAALAAAVAPVSEDAGAATETVWAALHGLAELERTGRIRPGARAARVGLLVRAFSGGGAPVTPRS